MLEQPLDFSQTQLVRLPELTYQFLCSTCVTYWTPLVTKCFPPNPCLRNPQPCVSAHIANLLAAKRYYLVGPIYVLGAPTDYYINHLSLVLNSLNY